jgi:diguanylate cyclase (GGDEF)-like protein/PAS domain S-box-containing protein
MLGRPGDWLTGHRIDDILHPDDHAIDQVLRREVQAGMQRSGVKECRLLRADGTVVWVEHAVGLVRDEAGAPVAYVSQFVDISEARESRRELEFLAGHDPLTRLSNRRSLVERMGTALEQLPRTGTRIGVVFLDLDGLKTVNDTYGHAAGDELIVQVAERIRRSVRSDDIVARLGGDEFVVVLIRVHDLGEASAVAGKIRAVMTQPIGLAQGQVVVTASAGVTLAEAGEAPDDAIARADSLLYQAKSAGGNRAIAL